ncbi:MAG: Retron-type reverse transcriptase-like protein [Sodalis sp. (in: enterobacteria)]
MGINEAEAQITSASGGYGRRYPLISRASFKINTVVSQQTKAKITLTMKAVVTRENLMLLYQRVVENKGAVGLDNLNVTALKSWLKQHEASVRAGIDGGRLIAESDALNRHPETGRRRENLKYPLFLG